QGRPGVDRLCSAGAARPYARQRQGGRRMAGRAQSDAARYLAGGFGLGFPAPPATIVEMLRATAWTARWNVGSAIVYPVHALRGAGPVRAICQAGEGRQWLAQL